MFGIFKKQPPPSSTKSQSAEAFPPHVTHFLQVITSGLQNERGVHIETVFATLGSLAGFATQMGLRKRFVDTGAMPAKQVFTELGCKNGEIFFVGESILEGLFRMQEGKLSVLSMTASAANSVGAKSFPNPNTIIAHVATTHGTELFGIPRLPNMPQYKPQDLLRDSWDGAVNWLLLHDKGEPLNWPFLIGQAIQVFAYQTKGLINPDAITHIVMECALPMAQVNPELIVGKLGTVQPLSIDLQRSEAGKLFTAEAFKKAVVAAKANDEKGV